MSKKYYLEVNSGGGYAGLFGWHNQWSCYGTIYAEGDTLSEVLGEAQVELLDQDGGVLDVIPLDNNEHHNAVVKEFLKRYGHEEA